MLKSAVAATALVAAGTTAYLVYSQRSESPHKSASAAPTPALRYGSGRLGLAHAPSLGPSSAPRALVSRSVAQADLAMLPGDSDAVFGVNFAQLRDSALWKQFVVPQLGNADGVREFEALCGFDPLTSLGSMSIGVKGMGGDDEYGVSAVIIVHGFDRTKAQSCFDNKGIAEAEKQGAKVTVDGEVVMISDPEGRVNVAFTFIDQTTALVLLGRDATRERIERIAAGTDSVQSSTTFASALQAINTDDSLWFIVTESSPLVAEINTATAEYTKTKLGTMYMSLNVTDSLALDAGLRLGTPDAVAKLVSAVQTQMKQPMAVSLSKHFDQLDVMGDGSDLIISMALSGDQILPLVMAIASNVQISAM